MLRLAIVPVLLCAGCLYLGDLNQPPILSATPSALSTTKGAPINVAVTITDDQDRPEQLTPVVVVSAADGQPATENCDYVVSNLSYFGYSVTFFRTGVFSIVTTVKDLQGASSAEHEIMISINNAPPTLTDAALSPTLAYNNCRWYVVGQAIQVHFSGTVNDSDQNATSNFPNCNSTMETLSYDWTIQPPPGSSRAVLTLADASGCTPMSASSGLSLTTSLTQDVCLWPDYGLPLAASSYGITLTVSDGGDTKATVSTAISVAAEGPPCIGGVYPPAGSHVVDPKDPEPFDTLTISSVADDLDFLAGGTFYWSLWRDSDPVWRSIPISGNQYTPDYSVFGVGEHVSIRVEVVDVTGVRAPCTDLTAVNCSVMSCSATTTTTTPAACNQWTTWNLELR